MRTERELNEDILKITGVIQEKFPELTKFIGEMPEKISNTGGTSINTKILQEYFDSLQSLLKRYAVDHKGLIR